MVRTAKTSFGAGERVGSVRRIGRRRERNAAMSPGATRYWNDPLSMGLNQDPDEALSMSLGALHDRSPNTHRVMSGRIV